MNRAQRHLLSAIAAIACVLFAEFAVAASGCEEAAAIPVLCQAHCDQDARSLDKPTVPPIAPLAANGLEAPAFVALFLPATPPAQRDILARSTSPPLAIKLCCFRI